MSASCFDLISSIGAGGCFARASLSSLRAASTGAFLSAEILSPASFRVFSTWNARPSALLRSSTSAWRFSSSAACASASLRISRFFFVEFVTTSPRSSANLDACSASSNA